jgi:hypothetical protein
MEVLASTLLVEWHAGRMWFGLVRAKVCMLAHGRGWPYPSSVPVVRRSMYFSQRSPTTCALVSMRRAPCAWWWVLYLAAGEAADGDDHFRDGVCVGVCGEGMRLASPSSGATRQVAERVMSLGVCGALVSKKVGQPR